MPPDWKLKSISVDDGDSATPSTYDLGDKTVTFNLDPGETIKATFTNEYLKRESNVLFVGITVYPVDKIGLLIPWLSLVMAAIVFAFLSVLAIRRRARY